MSKVFLNQGVSVKLLDLFCGAGGAAMGYSRAGFDVVGVDITRQPRFPFNFLLDDALDLPLSFLQSFDFIHASPPCQAYVQRNKNLQTKWPKLIEPTREKLQASGVPYVIENVEGSPLLSPTKLCGTMFGLLVLRHRLFECSLPLPDPPPCNHWGTVADGDFAGIYALGPRGRRRGRDAEGNKVRDHRAKPGPDWNVAMGIDWMTKAEIREAIPPAYTEWIGRHVLRAIAPAAPSRSLSA